MHRYGFAMAFVTCSRSRVALIRTLLELELEITHAKTPTYIL